MAGALSEFGRMPTGRKIAIFVVFGALGLFVWWKFSYKPVKADVEKERAAVATKVKEQKDIQDKLDALPALRATKAKLDRIIQEESRALPTDAEVPAFFEMLERKFTESGVQFVKWNKKQEELVESFVKVALDVELTGTFLQLKRFFASLEEKKQPKGTTGQDEAVDHDRIVSIENLSLTQPTIKNREMVLTAKFTAVTYRQEDVKPPEPTKPGQVPANSPVPQGGSNAAPLPTAGSAPPPADDTMGGRIKGKVDDSMKKDEDRVKRGTGEAGSGSARLKGGL